MRFTKCLTNGFRSLFEISGSLQTWQFYLVVVNQIVNLKTKLLISRRFVGELRTSLRAKFTPFSVVSMSQNFLRRCGYINLELLVFSNLYIAKMRSALTYNVFADPFVKHYNWTFPDVTRHLPKTKIQFLSCCYILG